jgi:hypothetical protein
MRRRIAKLAFEALSMPFDYMPKAVALDSDHDFPKKGDDIHTRFG